MSTALTHAEDTQITASNGRIALEPNPPAEFEPSSLVTPSQTPLVRYTFSNAAACRCTTSPPRGRRTEFLVPTSTTTHCPWKGDATYWTIEIGDRRAEDAVWTYPEQFDGSLDLSEYVAFYWDRMDAWYEEDQQVFVHARDPYVRIDALPLVPPRPGFCRRRTGRRDETTQTALRNRTAHAVLHSENRRSQRVLCAVPPDHHGLPPLQGTASYLSFTGTTELAPIEDLAWFYPFTTAEASGIDDHVSFYPERVGKILVDGAEI